MNYEALFLIGGLALLVGVILYLPFMLFFRWKRRRENLSPSRMFREHITEAGLLVYGILVGAMFVGFAQGHLAPETTFGQLMTTWLGRLVYTALLVPCLVLVAFVLKMRGYEMVRREGNDA